MYSFSRSVMRCS